MLVKIRLITLILDYILLVAAFSLAYFVRVGFIFSTNFPFLPYFLTSLTASAIWILSLVIFRGYSPFVRFSRLIHLLKVFIAGLTGTALFGLIFYFHQQALFSRLLLLYIFALGSAMMILFHLLIQVIEKHLINKGYGNIRLLIIGLNRGVKAFIQALKKETSPYVPVAILDGYGTKQKDIHGVPVLGKLNVLEQTIDEHRIDAVVQGDNIEQVINILHFCEQHHLDYFLLPYLLGMYQDNVRIQMIEKPLLTPKRPSGRTFWEKILS